MSGDWHLDLWHEENETENATDEPYAWDRRLGQEGLWCYSDPGDMELIPFQLLKEIVAIDGLK